MAATSLKARIDKVLNIRSVDEPQVDVWIANLDLILSDLLALPDREQALKLVWHFIDEIPKTFNLVSDETEQAMFCRELFAAAITLSRAANAPELEMGERVLDAVVKDLGQFNKMNYGLDVLLEAKLSTASREALAKQASSMAKTRSDNYEKRTLTEFAGKLVKGKRTRGGERR